MTAVEILRRRIVDYEKHNGELPAGLLISSAQMCDLVYELRNYGAMVTWDEGKVAVVKQFEGVDLFVIDRD